MKEVNDFLEDHPEILPSHRDQHRAKLVKRKVFNERKQKRDRERNGITKMTQFWWCASYSYLCQILVL